MKVFITGATGFIGKAFVKRLSQTEHDLFCLVRRTSDVGHLKEAGAHLVPGDVTDRDSMLEGMTGCDWVVHLANVYSFWEPDMKIYRKVNVEGTRNVMECALEAKVSKIIHVSTCATWGTPKDVPFTEESRIGYPHSEYARSKYAGDLIVWELYERRGLPVVMVYPAPVLGAGDPKPTGQYVYNLVKRKLPVTLLHDTVMTFVHVRDVGEGILLAAEKEGNIGAKYLLGNDQLSFKEVNALVRDISGVSLPFMKLPDLLVMPMAVLLTGLANLIKKPPLWGMATDQIRTMQHDIIFDGSKAERELGLVYTPLRDAIEDMVRSYA